MQPLCKLNIFKIFLPKRRHSTHKKLMSFIFSFGLSDPKGIHPPELERPTTWKMCLLTCPHHDIFQGNRARDQLPRAAAARRRASIARCASGGRDLPPRGRTSNVAVRVPRRPRDPALYSRSNAGRPGIWAGAGAGAHHSPPLSYPSSIGRDAAAARPLTQPIR